MSRYFTAVALILSCGVPAGCARFHKSSPIPAASEFVVPPVNGGITTRLPPTNEIEEAQDGTPATDESVPTFEPYHWRDRPFSGGYQIGWLMGDPLEKGARDVPNGLFLAKRYGWDFADHWGLEGRLADAWQSELNRFTPTKQQTEQAILFDLSVLYYPLGETRLRPYFTAGAGLADFKFVNQQSTSVHRMTADLPFGVGIKYPVRDWLVLRVELLDNLSIAGDGLPTTDNVSLTGGAEIRFGDLRKHLFPFWNR